MSHLQFANDTIFFSRVNMEDLQNFKVILMDFRHISSLKISLDKSILSDINMSQHQIIVFASTFERKVF